MNTKITLNYLLAKDEKLHQQMTDHFIKMIKHFNALVFQESDDILGISFLGIASGILVHANHVPESYADRIKAEFSPFQTTINGLRSTSNEQRCLNVEFITKMDIEQLPSRIIEEQRLEKMDEWICHSCHQSFILHMDQKFCTYCGTPVANQAHGNHLRVCMDCKSHISKGKPGLMFPHDFIHCPRCGGKLIVLDDQPKEWEYQGRGWEDFRQEMIQWLGVPLDDFDFAKKVRKKFKKGSISGT